MTALQSARERNDLLRTKFEGGRVLITLYNRFLRIDDDHSEGSFTFAGYFWVWRIEDFAGERCLTLSVAADLL
jgi:hypothetical protein